MKHWYALGLLACVACSPGTFGDEDVAVFTSPSGCIHNVIQRIPGGWLLREPEVHFDFWGDYWTNQVPDGGLPEEQQYWVDWTDILTRGTVLQRLDEYGIHGGSLEIVVHNNDTSANIGPDTDIDEAGLPELSDSVFPAQLNLEISLDLLPYPNDNSLYVVMLPPGVTTQHLVNDNAAAYHNWASYGSQRYAYAVIGYQGANQADDAVLSHEIYEAATDPDVKTGFIDWTTGDEIADLCEDHRGQSNVVIGGVTVQKVWSQAACTCE
jgi:hypothetical protein